MDLNTHNHNSTPAHNNTPQELQESSAKHHGTALSGCLWMLRHWRFSLSLIVIAIVGFGVWKVYSLATGDEPLLGITHTTAIDQTPEEILALRDIGEWEFLAAPCEELVERHEAHTFGDKHLVRIYRGTLRIGIDMSKASDNWFRTEAASSSITPGVEIETPDAAAILTLPDVALLDSTFIDEARTTTFYEEGTFSAKIKQQLYDEAQRAMIRRTVTPENIEAARKTAREQFTRIFHALGFEKVTINFESNK